jgi:hypothetical protein
MRERDAQQLRRQRAMQPTSGRHQHVVVPAAAAVKNEDVLLYSWETIFMAERRMFSRGRRLWRQSK